ncbi:hypothetical protein D3C81_1558330 [compost metagenome]
MREEFDGGDVGIGVGHTSSQQRTRVSLLLAELAKARHKIKQRGDVEDEPAYKGPYQLRIKYANQDDHGRHVDTHSDNDVGQHENGFAHCK